MATSLGKLSVSPARKYLPVCVLDDETEQLERTTNWLTNAGFPVLGTTSPQDALQKVRMEGCRVLVADLKSPDMDGLAFLDKALQHDPGLQIVLVSSNYSVDDAVDAIKRGAHEYLPRPFDLTRLEKILDEVAEIHAQRAEARDLEEKLFKSSQFQGIVGKSPAMLEVFDLARKVARHYRNVLITGPTGAGKELIARVLFQLSPVSQQRFAICNCSAIVDTLLESQLFGHVRGAFTGATETRAGLFEYANGGTVLLDEIGETSLQMQSKLLRVIQNREIQRVGHPELKSVDVRLIAATNRDLRADVASGRFREDLFYRISTIEIKVPGLVDRREDVPVLVQHFLKKYSYAYGKPFQGLTRRAQIVLLRYDWPGNVRELENVISSAAITATAGFIDVSDLPEHVQRPQSRSPRTDGDWLPLPLAEVRRAHIQRVLEMCKGNRVRTAQILEIGRTSLYRFLRRGASPGNGVGDEG